MRFQKDVSSIGTFLKIRCNCVYGCRNPFTFRNIGCGLTAGQLAGKELTRSIYPLPKES